jgi:hypothetical protein
MTRLKLLQSSVSLLRVHGHAKLFAAGILFGLAIDLFYIFPLPYLSASTLHTLVSDWAFSDMFQEEDSPQVYLQYRLT